jgi:hypothetical protein
MKAYVVVIEDRHADVEVRVFDNPERAIQVAREIATENARRPDDFEEEEVRGWLYFARYSCEDDSVHVQEVEVEN